MTGPQTPKRSLIPALGWIRGYSRDWLRLDLVAGLTAGAVVIPKAMAYATIAGLPLQVGLYTAIVPMLIYALLGTSRPLSVSTTTTIAILVAAAVSEHAPGATPEDLEVSGAALALLTGGILVLASILKFGFVANFISESVLIGFKAAIALVITVDQIPKMLGIHIQKAGFFRDILAIAHHLPDSSLITLALALVLFGLIFALEHFVPRAPAPLIVLALAIAASSLWLKQAGVETVGAIPTGLPGFVRPRLDLIAQLWPAAAGIALMSFTETIAAARAFHANGEPRLVPNQELLAVGLANVGGALFGTMPAGGGTSQTAVNRRAGARTQLAEVVTALAALATLLLLAPVIGLMPQAALAAVVVAYSVELIKPADFRAIRRVRRGEFRWALIAVLGVLLLGTLKGILVAVIASLLALAYQMYNPAVYTLGRIRGSNAFRPLSKEHGDDETWPGLLILRPEGRIFFANAPGVGERMLNLVEEARPSVVLLDLSAVIDIEYTALKMLTEGEEKLAGNGVTLWVTGLNPTVRSLVDNSRLGERLEPGRRFIDLATAVKQYQTPRPATKGV
jgi:high affinity sulfate transporter 1